MLRELQTILDKNVDAMYKADVAMKTGMGVIKNYENKVVELPAEETAENIFFVNKERIPYGIDTARSDMSDYDESFINIAENELVKLITPVVGEAYGTDQYLPDGLVSGDVMSVNTDGLWVKAATGVESRFIYTGTVVDNGRTLARIEVSATTKSNA